ncbi:hypothetical protein BCL57_000311 [Agromyces flavus]|uniref:Uncharacterized protein n=1 Tax=Agromyces flavus TaxID=589382 RepID=A0A1H1WGM9_9MICO|nr:hypothetical protein [Agromyces flavus]MCP2366169.1 hypothetical protein [Agromyces flavus]GGI44138.1 hypothetical protein GCM10010932_03110 [Agromyces flavus]SDS96192.1 hypothetical protein SAMN04489721_2239 [Agromyces flavus]
MSDANQRVMDGTLASLPGGVMLWHARRLLLWALGAGFVYSVVTGSSRSICPGGFAGEGGYIDGFGQPTEVAPTCTSLTLHPSPLVYVIIAFVVLVELTRVLERAVDEADAIRIIERARAAVICIALGSALISHIWFWSIPMTETGFGNSISPVLFGGITTETYPMNGD